MTTQSPTPTHKSVQDYYGKVAQEAETCCSDSSCCGQPQNVLYPAELLSELPFDIANFTAGSGDPVTLALLQEGETVLDLGSGGGLDCFLAAKQVGPTGSVIGVDMTPEMLGRARSGAQRLGISNVEFRQGYLESLPVESGTVDVVISNCVINLAPDKTPVFQEMFRALKPGGRIAVSDIVREGPALTIESLREHLSKSGGKLIANINGKMVEMTLEQFEAQMTDEWCACVSGALEVSEYKQRLQKTGFIEVEIVPSKEFSASLEGDCRQASAFPAQITARKPV